MAQSWFYLTLWHGNPPEMTDYVDAVIDAGDGHVVTVITTSAHAGALDTTDRAAAVIHERDSGGVEIEERNEVVWIVGKGH